MAFRNIKHDITYIWDETYPRHTTAQSVWKSSETAINSGTNEDSEKGRKIEKQKLEFQDFG